MVVEAEAGGLSIGLRGTVVGRQRGHICRVMPPVSDDRFFQPSLPLAA